MTIMLAALAVAAPLIPSEHSLGTEQAACRPDETGPAIQVRVVGLKDRKGTLRIELYPQNDDDFLADDNVLISAGKVFRRVVGHIPPSGPATLCIRAPHPGPYAMMIMHDRNGNWKFDPFSDGAGFPGNPRLRWAKPPAEQASVTVKDGVLHISVRMNYMRGLAFRPLPHKDGKDD